MSPEEKIERQLPTRDGISKLGNSLVSAFMSFHPSAVSSSIHLCNRANFPVTFSAPSATYKRERSCRR